MSALEPALKGNFYGGFHTTADFTGDIHKFTNGLAKACERLGVEMCFSTEVSSVDAGIDSVTIISRSTEPRLDGLEHEDEIRTFDKVVVCGGVTSRMLASSLGDRVNVYPVKGYSITVNLSERSDQEAAPWKYDWLPLSGLHVGQDGRRRVKEAAGLRRR